MKCKNNNEISATEKLRKKKHASAIWITPY